MIIKISPIASFKIRLIEFLNFAIDTPLFYRLALKFPRLIRRLITLQRLWRFCMLTATAQNHTLGFENKIQLLLALPFPGILDF